MAEEVVIPPDLNNRSEDWYDGFSAALRWITQLNVARSAVVYEYKGNVSKQAYAEAQVEDWHGKAQQSPPSPKN